MSSQFPTTLSTSPSSPPPFLFSSLTFFSHNSTQSTIAIDFQASLRLSTNSPTTFLTVTSPFSATLNSVQTPTTSYTTHELPLFFPFLLNFVIPTNLYFARTLLPNFRMPPPLSSPPLSFRCFGAASPDLLQKHHLLDLTSSLQKHHLVAWHFLSYSYFFNVCLYLFVQGSTQLVILLQQLQIVCLPFYAFIGESPVIGIVRL